MLANWVLTSELKIGLKLVWFGEYALVSIIMTFNCFFFFLNFTVQIIEEGISHTDTHN